MNESFIELFRGRLIGVMSEDEYDALAGSLDGAWIAVDFSADEARVSSVSGEEAGKMMADMRDEIKARNMLNVTYPYTYVHTPEAPRMIKLYDPRRCGSGCSTSSPDPWWVFSTTPPAEAELEELKPSRKRKGLRGLFG